MACSCGVTCATDGALAAHLTEAGDGHAPAGPELTLACALERAHAPPAASHQHAVLSVVAPSARADRAPVHLVAVLDRSGSMSGEKLRLVLATMRFMLQHLRPGDQLGVVSYDTEVRVDAALTHCGEDGKRSLEQALGQVRAGSMTNLSGGLLEGLALHRGREVALGNTYTGGPGGAPAPAVPARGYPQTRGRASLPAPTRLARPDSDASMGSSDSDTQHQARPPRVQQRAAQSQRASTPAAPEWAVELRDPAGVVRTVEFTLPGGEVVAVSSAPFRVARADAGLRAPAVRAVVTLHSGAVVNLEHELCLQPGGAFRRVELPGAPAPAGIVRSTLLFTDGLANNGIQDTPGICAAARAALGESPETRSTIHTFGFGADHNAEMLRAIAQVGDGEYFFIESQDNVADSFGEAIGGLLSTTHQNIQLEVAAAPGVGVEPLTAFQHETEGNTTTITLGDLFAEERRDVLVRVAVPADAEVLAVVTARAYSLAAQRMVDLGPVELRIGRSDAPEQGNPEVLKHVHRHVATCAMDAARQRAQQGDLAAARAAMQAAEAQLTAAGASDCALTNGLLADLRDAQGSMQEQDEYARMGSKKLACMSRMHTKQRACAYEASPATDMYAGSAQRAMKSAFKRSVQ